MKFLFALSWIEVWERKRRQYMCGHSPSVWDPQNAEEYTCRHPDDDLRNALCHNKGNKSLIDVLKTDIECGWSSAETFHYRNIILWIAIIIYNVHILQFY